VSAGPDGVQEAVVTALSSTPVKGLRMQSRNEVLLTEVGVPGNRSFFLIDGHDRMVNAKQLGALLAVVADYDDEQQRLSLRFPDGATVADEVRVGETVETQFYSSPLQAELVLGPFSAAVSEHVGAPLRLVRADPRLSAIDRGPRGGVSLISEASLRHLSGLAGETVDPRRFRMVIEVSGFEAYGEDALVGGRARIGGALVAFHGHVGRCLITGRDPETGQPNLPTLELFSTYRRELDTTKPLAFGVYGEVLEPGRVKLGDALRQQ
jgi:uncharacterized protein YcbX